MSKLSKYMEKTRKSQENINNSNSSASNNKGASKLSKYIGNRREEEFKNQINFDTLQTDITYLSKTIGNVYNGWQTRETMENTRSSVQSMYDRLGKYQEYQKQYGGTDLSELQNSYKAVLDGWDEISNKYSQYESADAYNKEISTLKELGTMTSSDVEGKLTDIKDLEGILKTAKEHQSNVRGLTVKKNTWEHRGRGLDADGGYADKLKAAEKEYNDFLKSVGFKSVDDIEKALSGKRIAYTTVGGENITWQSLYDKKKQTEESDAQYKEISSMDDFELYRDIGANIENPTWEEADVRLFGKKDIGNIVEYANANKEMIGLSNAYGSFGDDRVLYTLMTDKEREIHNYHLGRELEGLAEKGTAEKYLKSIEGILKDRHENQLISGLVNYTEEHPALGSAISVWQNLGAGVEWLYDSANYLTTGELDTNHLAKASSSIRSTVSQNVDWEIGNWDAFDFVYNTGMSMIDSGVAMATFGGAGGVVLGMSAAAQGTNDALARGLDNKSAFFSGLSAGVFEGVFESLSIGKFKALKDAPVDGLKTIIKNVGKSMLTNASEETLTELANLTYDYIVNGDLSNAKTQIRAYVNSGMSEKEAIRKVALEQAAQVVEAGASGALMGFGFGGVAGVSAYNTSKHKGQDIKANERVAEVFDIASNPEVASAYEVYTQYANKGINADNITDAQLGSLYTKAKTDAVETLKSKKSTSEQKSEALKTLAKLTVVDTENAIKQEAKKFNVGKETKVTNSGETVDIKDLKVNGDKIAVTTEKGEISVDDITLTQNDAELVAFAKEIAKTDGEDVANLFISQYDSQTDVYEYANAFNLTMAYAKNNFRYDTILNKKGVLSTKAVNAIYQKTRIKADKEKADYIKKLNKKMADKKFYKGLIDDSVIDYENTSADGKVNWVDLDTRQKQAVTFIKGFAQATGMNLVLEHNPEGKYNGKFEINSNTITIDISNPGKVYQLKETIIPTMSHETTHWMKDKSPELYRHLNEIVFSTLAEHYNSNTEQAIKDKLEILKWADPEKAYTEETAKERTITEEDIIRAEVQKKGKSLDESRDEIIARACEDILAMSERGKKIFNSLSKNERKTFAEKLKGLVDDLLNWVNDLLNSYESTSTEARIMREYKEELQKAAKIWDEMLGKSIKANQSLEKSGEYSNKNAGGKILEQARELQRKDPTKLTEEDFENLLGFAEQKLFGDDTYIPARINTPQILIAFAKEQGYVLENHPLAMSVYKARQALSTESKWDGNPKDKPHNLTVGEVVEIVKAMNNPSHLVYQTNNDRFAEIVKFVKDGGKEKAYAIIDFFDVDKNPDLMNGYEGGKYNILVTIYPSEDSSQLKQYLKNKNNIVMTGEEMKKKGISQGSYGSYVPSLLNDSPFYTNSIPNPDEKVKEKYSDRDTEYIAAVKNGDMKTVQRMVDEAAKRWGALTDENGNVVYAYRGDRQKGKTVFNPGEHHDRLIFTSTSESVGNAYKGDGAVYKFYIKEDGLLEIEGNYGVAQDILIPEELSSVNTDNRAKATVNEIGVMAREAGYKGVYVKNIRDGSGFVWADDVVLFEGGSQMKSAEPVTYDDNGNVIPLSKRFDSKNMDIRYSERDFSYNEAVVEDGVVFNHVLNIEEKNDKIKEENDVEFSDEFEQIFNKAILEVKVTKVSMKVFPPYNKSKSDANEHATRWAHNDNVQTGAQAIVFYKNGSYIIEKFDSTDLKYIIKGRIRYDDYRNIRRELEANARAREESVEELAAVYDKRNRQGNSTQERGQSADSNATKYRGKDYTIQRVDKNKDSERKIEGNPNRRNERDSANRQNRDLEKQIRFSERDDSSVYDIMGETDRILKENENFKAEIERLNERLKIERKVTKGSILNTNQLLSAAGHLRNISNSTIDKVELARSLKDVYSFIANSKNLTWEEVFEKCHTIAEVMLDAAKPEVMVDDYYKQILKDIRNTRISLSESQKKEARNIFDKNWNRYFFGKVIITDKGLGIDSQWQEWASMYPGVFDADISDGDMIVELYNIISTLQEASETVVEYDNEERTRWLANEIYNQYWNVSPIRTTADKYDKQIKRLNFEHRKAMTELRDDYNLRLEEQHKADKDKYTKLAKKIREHRDKQIALAKQHGRERLNKYKENAERKTRIQSITSNALSLNEMLIKNSKDKHIPEIMREPVTALLQAIDFSSKRLLEKGEPTQNDISLSKALSKVKDMMVKASNAHDELVELYGHGLDDDIESLVDSVDNIMRTVGDNEFVLNKMTATDLQTLDKTVKTIKHAVNKLNKFHTVNHARGIANLSQESVLYLDSLGKGKVYDGIRGIAKRLVNWNNSLPYYVFKRFGSGGTKVYEALQDGWDKFAFNTKKIIDYANDAYTSKEVKEWSEEVKTFKILVPANTFELGSKDYVPQYQEVQLTVPQIMSMYCLNKREQARGHLFQGGIRVADFKDKKGGIISQSEGIIFTEKDISTILDSLTDRQKAVADKLQKFMNTVCAEWGNDVSMARFGYKAFGEENYFPIQSDKNNLAVNDETEQQNSLFRLLNMSFTKSTIESANNRIVISDIFDVFAQHTSDMAKYNALALPVLDSFKWYNYTEKESIADGTFKTIGVKQSMERAFGKDGQNYFTTFLKDINGSQETDREQLSKAFMRNYKIASVGANLRVVLLQPTSYLRASAIIDNKYLTKALVHKPKIKKAETYCGIALWKSMGYFDTNIQRSVTEQIKHAETFKDKATNLSMKGAEIADKVTWGYLWNACELEIRDKRKDLRVGSTEFYDAIAKRLREVIYATQVVDSTMTRSQMMRSSKMHDLIMTNFASEPTLSYNMLQDAYMELSLDTRRIGKKEAWKKNGKRMARVVSAYTVTNALAALVESGFDAFRDDDDDEMDLVTFMKLYFSNFASDMSITGKIPYVKEVHSLLKGYSLSRSELAWMESMWNTVSGVNKNLHGKGKPITTIKNGLKTLSYLSSLPFYNIFRDTMATLNKFDLFTADELNEILKEFLPYDIEKEK